MYVKKLASATVRSGVSLSLDTSGVNNVAKSRNGSADAHWGKGMPGLGTHSNMVTGLFRYVTMYVAFYSSREAQKRLR